MPNIKPITDSSFKQYARVIEDIDTLELLAAMENTPTPDDVIYVPSDPALEALDVFSQFRERLYGGLPIQLGYCNGDNHILNALEYHRDSEVNLACTDLIFLIGRQQDIDYNSYTYDTGLVEAFLIPKGTLLDVYATTLHYAPISAEGKFRCVVVLPRGTNTPLAFEPNKTGEGKLLFATNKWLIAHPESGLDANGAHVGLIGENIAV